MERKVSTILEESTYRKLKIEAVRQGRTMRDLFEDALTAYLMTLRQSYDSTSGTVVDRTYGTLPATMDELEHVMEEEDGLFDA